MTRLSDQASWTVTKRYSEFAALRDTLQKHYNIQADNFPRKHLFRSNSMSVVKERVDALSEFIDNVLLPNWSASAVAEFLELFSMRIRFSVADVEHTIPNNEESRLTDEEYQDCQDVSGAQSELFDSDSRNSPPLTALSATYHGWVNYAIEHTAIEQTEPTGAEQQQNESHNPNLESLNLNRLSCPTSPRLNREQWV